MKKHSHEGESKKGRRIDQGAPDAAAQLTVAPTEADYAGSLEYSPVDREKMTVISFFVSGSEYAFAVSEALEVVKPRPLTEVPHAPSYIKGIFSLRGEMVPVIDLNERLGGAPLHSKPYGSRILIALIDDMKTGFWVDRLSGIRDVFLADVATLLPGQESRQGAGFARGVIKSGGGEMLFLDPTRLADSALTAV